MSLSAAMRMSHCDPEGASFRRLRARDGVSAAGGVEAGPVSPRSSPVVLLV